MADSKLKKKDDRELSYSELISKRNALKKEYMDFRFKMVVSHVDNPMQKRTMRREIARLNTFIRQKEKMQKSIVVTVTTKKMDKLYKKYVTRSKKYMAHDEREEAHIGDTVRIMECRPLSKHKCWRLVEIVERAK